MEQFREFKPYYNLFSGFCRDELIEFLQIILFKIDSLIDSVRQGELDGTSDVFRDFGLETIKICIAHDKREMAKELAQKLVHFWSDFCDSIDLEIDDIFNRLLPIIYNLAEFGFKKEADQLIPKAISCYIRAIKEGTTGDESCTLGDTYWEEIYDLSQGELRKELLKVSEQSLFNDLKRVKEGNPYRKLLLESIDRIETALANL